MQSAELHIVSTPIGNLDDMTHRAVQVLSTVDLIAAEDTRHSRVLLDHFGIRTKVVSLHEHNEESEAPRLVQHLLGGKSLALVSDAGTPLLSDPGYRLVQLAIAAGITVRSVPGASAVTAALPLSGLPTDRFVFEGFLPPRAVARRNYLESLRLEPRTLVFFESSHRVLDSVEDMSSVFGDGRAAAICRELTKRFETVLRGTLGKLHQVLAGDADQQKGEFVIVVSGAPHEQSVALASATQLARSLQEFLPLSQAVRVAAKLHGVDRRPLYGLLSAEQTGEEDQEPA